jgi:hypothetical protein
VLREHPHIAAKVEAFGYPFFCNSPCNVKDRFRNVEDSVPFLRAPCNERAVCFSVGSM